MEINNLMQANIYSLQQALGIANLQKAMNQDAQAVGTLLQDMQTTTAKTMEMAVNPHLGSTIDVKL